MDDKVKVTSAWPPGDGEMVQRVRVHDWAATSLGPTQRWPERLKAAVEMTLASPFVSSILCGPDRILIYNDAASRLYGARHPAALGRPLSETFPEGWVTVAPLYARAFAGETVHVEAQPLDTRGEGKATEVFGAYLTPVRAADGTVAAVHMAGFEIGARLATEAALRANEARQALLLRLGDALRTISDPTEIQQIAMRLLGEHLGLARVYYFNVERDADGGWVHVIQRGYRNDPALLEFVGPYALKDFGSEMFEGFARGEVIAVSDIGELPGLTDEQRAAYRAVGVTAFVNVPLLRDGEYSAGIGAHDTEPHRWSQDEFDLIREVAARTWAASERARAETELRENENRLAVELRGTQLLQRLSTRLIKEQLPEVLHEQILDAALELMQADAVSIQLLEEGGQRLRRLATRNLHPESTEYWTWVDAGHASTCGQALRTNSRVVVEDVEASAELSGTGDLEAFRRSGTRAVQSTPLVSRSGRPIGMISTHWHEPQRLAQNAFGLFDILARQIADLLERSQTEAALRGIRERQAFLFKLSDALRPLADPAKIKIAASQVLGEHFGVNRAFYAEAQNSHWLVANGYYEEGIEPLPDTPFPMATYGQWIIDDFRAGRSLIVRDMSTDARRFQESERAAQQALQIAASVAVPLVKDGALVAMLVLHTIAPRDWTSAEVRLLEEVADRTWAAVERALAEAALRASEKRYRSAMRVGHIGSWETDLANGIRHWSPEGMALFGIDLPGGKGRIGGDADEWQAALHPEERELPARIRTALLTEDAVRVEYRIVRPDGVVVWLHGHAEVAARDPLGRPTRLMNVSADVTESRMASQAMRESEERLRQFGEASQDVLWMRDAEHLRWTYLTPAFETIYGISREEALTGNDFRNWADLILPEDRANAIESIGRVRNGERVTFEFRIRRPSDGEIRWMRNTDFPMQDEAGRVASIGGVGTDITADKEIAGRMEVMVAELQHRTRNLIAVVRSIAGQTMASTGPTEAFRDEFNHRLESLSRVQGLLSYSTDEPITIEGLIRMELEALGAADMPDRVHIGGPAVRLRRSVVQTLALALHELATNARKYGALAAKDGRLSVTWWTYEEAKAERLMLEWTETGGPRTAHLALRHGYGRELIERALPYALNAKTSFELNDAGVHCTIDLPLTNGGENGTEYDRSLSDGPIRSRG